MPEPEASPGPCNHACPRTSGSSGSPLCALLVKSVLGCTREHCHRCTSSPPFPAATGAGSSPLTELQPAAQASLQTAATDPPETDWPAAMKTGTTSFLPVATAPACDSPPANTGRPRCDQAPEISPARQCAAWAAAAAVRQRKQRRMERVLKAEPWTDRVVTRNPPAPEPENIKLEI